MARSILESDRSLDGNGKRLGDGTLGASHGAGRVSELDALRGLAALAVVFFHLLPGPFYWAWLGVDFFFVLSGFLITRIILEGSTAPSFLRNFYARRILRIWPIYYLAIAVAGLLAFLSKTPQPLGGLPYMLFFLQNVPAYWGGATPPFTLRMGHTWTIAVEEQFYLIWPLILPRVGRRLPWLVGLLVAMAFCLRMVYPRVDLLLTRCDGLALGAALAWYWQVDRQRLFSPQARLARVALLLVIIVYAAWGTRTYGKPFLDVVPLWRAPTILAVSLAAAIVVIGVLLRAGTRALAPLRLRPLVYLGQISYGLYLYHLLVFWVADGLQLRYGWERSAVFNTLVVLGCIGAAAASWELIERPILGLRTRFPLTGPALVEPVKGGGAARDGN
jgi:peptidoglycan/LPS O-acetylase OafA/YrhL